MLSNVALLGEILLICFEMLFGNALMVLGGWFEFALLFENEFESIKPNMVLKHASAHLNTRI